MVKKSTLVMITALVFGIVFGLFAFADDFRFIRLMRTSSRGVRGF